MRTWLFLLALLPNCTGCLYYAYPTLLYTPEQPVDSPGSTHAFRVDIDRTERKPAPTSTQYTLMRIPLDSRGLVPSQFEIAPASGVLNPLGITDSAPHERSEYTMTVRLYRPGFQTKELKAWGKAQDPHWLPASDLLGQEKAIDDLLAGPPTPFAAEKNSGFALEARRQSTWWEMKDQKLPRLGLQPGAVSAGQRQALQFAAGEYGRLANSPLANSPQMQAARERLQQKALWLKRYADQLSQ